MACKKTRGLSLDEILEELEKLESDEEGNARNPDFETNVYITPPDDGMITDEDSGDEEGVNIKNLPGSQLIAAANIGGEENENISHTINLNKSNSKKKKQRNWITKDLLCKQFHNQNAHKPSTADFPRKPAEIFELFVDDDVINLLTRETVQYAAQRGKHNFTLTSDEMRVFIGILILSGYNPVSRRPLYWQNEPDTYNELISNSIRRNKMDEIMFNFHAANNATLAKNDKFAKIRPLLDILNKNFLVYGNVFVPISLSIDESMVPYFGRHNTKQFIRGKPIRWGYKAWVIASPLVYAFKIDFYQGKVEDSNTNKYREEFGVGGSVVLDFIDSIEKQYPNVQFSFYFDNFFTSIKLLEEIKNRGHGATGTIRSNRMEQCPFSNQKAFKKFPRGKEEHFIDTNNNIIIVRWNDNSVLHIGSNEYGVEPMKRVERWSSSEKKKVTVPMPNCISQYNKNMGGVDRLDENISKYRISIRGKKWYFPILTYLFDVCVNNAWLFARNGGYKLDKLAFTRSLVVDWLKKYGTPPTNVLRRRMALDNKMISEDARFDGKNHNIVKSEPVSRQRCKACKSQTVYKCIKCEVFLHVKCSLQFHSK